MKKTVSILMSILLSLSLVACNAHQDVSDGGGTDSKPDQNIGGEQTPGPDTGGVIEEPPYNYPDIPGYTKVTSTARLVFQMPEEMYAQSLDAGEYFERLLGLYSADDAGSIDSLKEQVLKIEANEAFLLVRTDKPMMAMLAASEVQEQDISAKDITQEELEEMFGEMAEDSLFEVLGGAGVTDIKVTDITEQDNTRAIANITATFVTFDDTGESVETQSNGCVVFLIRGGYCGAAFVLDSSDAYPDWQRNLALSFDVVPDNEGTAPMMQEIFETIETLTEEATGEGADNVSEG